MKTLNPIIVLDGQPTQMHQKIDLNNDGKIDDIKLWSLPTNLESRIGSPGNMTTRAMEIGSMVTLGRTCSIGGFARAIEQHAMPAATAKRHVFFI